MRAWMWALIAGFEVAAATARAGTDGLDLLREVVEQNPADSELAWLWTEELENAGRTAEADQTLSKFVDRFGSQRPGAMRRRGQRRYQLGEFEAALDALETASEQAPLDGVAHFYRGLALRRLQRDRSAERALRVAARIEPSLEPEVFLMLGMDHMQDMFMDYMMPDGDRPDGGGAQMWDVVEVTSGGPDFLKFVNPSTGTTAFMAARSQLDTILTTGDASSLPGPLLAALTAAGIPPMHYVQALESTYFWLSN